MTAEEESEGPESWSAVALKAARKKAKLTQARLAELTGIDRAIIIHLEKGRRTLSQGYAVRLAKHLPVKARDLVAPRVDDPVPRSPMDLLRQLGETVEKQAETIRAHEDRLEVLELAAGIVPLPATVDQ